MKTVSKKTNRLYWIFTILFALLMLGSSIPDIIVSDIAVKGMHQELGYPLYFIPFIGVAKLLGVIAILIPGYRAIKEWAYAGLMFDLGGATYSIILANPTGGSVLFMILPLSIGIIAYVFYRKKYYPLSTAARLAGDVRDRMSKTA